ncbi:MAG: hypothetical protein MJE66_02400 [Proteobacteria bacterium]|nr:hypothetical protein [Pseudomonadota bacterium]
MVRGDEALRRLKHVRCGMLGALTFKEGSYDVAQLATDIAAWGFVFDDYIEHFKSVAGLYPKLCTLEEVRDELGTFVNMLETWVMPKPTTAFHVAVMDMAKRGLAICGEPKWVAHFTAALSEYFGGLLQEFPYRLEPRHNPSLEVYLQARNNTLAVPMFYAVQELETGLLSSREMPKSVSVGPEEIESVIASDPLTRAKYLSNRLVGDANDLYSYEKESGDTFSLIPVICRTRGVSVRQAFLEGVQILHDDLDAFTKLSRQLLSTDVSPAVRGYLRCLYYWVHGCYWWEAMTPRYQVDEPMNIITEDVGRIPLERTP